MATKLFKIGEYSYYGKWRLTIKADVVNVQGIDWDTGKVCAERNFVATTGQSLNTADSTPLDEYLTEMSTVYYGEEMMKWLKAELKKQGREYKEPSLFGGNW